MTYVVKPDRTSRPIDTADLGGKAAALYALHRHDIQIPEWFVIKPSACRRGRSLQNGSQHQSSRLDIALWAEIEETIATLGLEDTPLAVRSSAAVEDQAEHSFAGQFESRLRVTLPELPGAIAAVWDSSRSAQASAYRQTQNLKTEATAPAVLIQRMLEPEAAGIAFSANPVNGRRDRCIIAAVPGLGDRLAAGEVSGDTFHVDRDGAVCAREPGPDPSGLDDGQIVEVATLARRLERIFGSPQDIEWAYQDDRLYLLQSRPITNLVQADPGLGDTPRLWDNSNIVESYGGIVSPLTFSFARRAYTAVYRQFARLMGVSTHRIRQNDHVFEHMLGLIQGRVYYNLLNWYRLLKLFPGYALNRQFMEQMMGVAEALPPDLADEVAGDADSTTFEKCRDALNLATTLTAMIKKRMGLGRDVRAFNRRVDEALNQSSDELANQSLEELIETHRALEVRLLEHWDAPLVNDFFCMIAFGVLGRCLEPTFGAEATNIRNRLVAQQGEIVSAEPVRRMHEMATLARDDQPIIAALLSGSPAIAWPAIADRPAFHRHIDDYMARFGSRCFEELKLESPTLNENPAPLFQAVASLACRSASDRPAKTAENDAVDEQIASHYSGKPMRRWLLRRLIAETRARLRDRENLRFERTRVFGRVRELFRHAGKRLYQAGVLEDAGQVFFLEVDEILGFVDGTTPCSRLGDLARARTADYEAIAEQPAPPSRFITRGAALAAKPDSTESPDQPGDEENHAQRSGLGCSAGQVSGTVCAVRNPHEASIGEGDILVAEHTDPGWVVLFSRAAGIIVERGSLLSHSAIVAREMGIPAVVALPGLMSWLEDGDVVEMDGGSGQVRRLSRAESPAIAAE